MARTPSVPFFGSVTLLALRANKAMSGLKAVLILVPTSEALRAVLSGFLRIR
jgi:hypothetical protein